MAENKPRGFAAKLWKWIADFPSTNGRIMATIVIFYLTALRYIASGTRIGFESGAHIEFDAWEPNWEWCVLVAAALGIDSAHYFAKRKTHMESPPADVDVEDKKAGATVPPATDTFGDDK